MQRYTEDEFLMIPMAMNAFYYNIPVGTKRITYADTVSISADFLESLLEYLNQISEESFIILDVEGVDYSFRLFERFRRTKRKIIFVNINSTILQDKMKENLTNLQFSANARSAALNMAYDSIAEEASAKYSGIVAHKIYMQIVKNLTEQSPKEPIKLDSSGMYSNMYVNVKSLFLHPEEYYAIVFGLAKKVVESKIEFDGFVSSSKNGALLANLLGVMLDKKVIHILGVGPKYSMNIGNLQKEIRKRGNYIYVFDFSCTGTEMKILSALINANDAYIKGAVGIAVYNNDLGNIVDDHMMCLVNVKEEGLPYKIAGEKKDVIRLAKQEDTQ